MISGLEKVRSKRIWFVPDISIWGAAQWGRLKFLALEQVDSELSVHFGQADLGDNAQELIYAQLTDHRGNSLPVSIESPMVMLRSRDEHAAFVVGRESDQSVLVARDSESTEPVTADALIVEMGG